MSARLTLTPKPVASGPNSCHQIDDRTRCEEGWVDAVCWLAGGADLMQLAASPAGGDGMAGERGK